MRPCLLLVLAAAAAAAVDAPVTPGFVVAKPRAAGEIELQWLDRCPDETGYRVERQTAGGGWTLVATLGAGSRGRTDSGLPAGSTQAYRITTLRAAGDAVSETVRAKVAPPAPGDGAVAVTVDWAATSAATIRRRQFAMNLYKIYEQGPASDPRYRAHLAATDCGMLRIHRWDMMQSSATNHAGWVIDPGTAAYRWDRARIAACLAPLRGLDAELMMCLTNFPAHLLQPGTQRLRSDAVAAYAAFCADLVRLCNVELGLGIRYWEVFNELDTGSDAYNGDHATLGGIYRTVAAALRAVDPAIRVGGPALAQPTADGSRDERDFIAAAGDQLDFVSMHTYATGDTALPLGQLYAGAQGLDWWTHEMRRRLVEGGRPQAEVFHDEFNLSWAERDDRRTNAVSAVYDALALKSAAVGRCDGLFAWNEMDGYWGKMSNGWERRPSAFMFEAFNAALPGAVVAASSSDAARVDVLAALGPQGPALALINRGLAPATVRCADAPAGSGSWTVTEIGGWGRRTGTLTAAQLATGYAMAADAVSVLVWVGANRAPAIGTGAVAAPDRLVLP